MPVDLPYMPSVTNLHAILDKIVAAATPPKFTYDFLKANLGFGSSNDRAVIKILKSMGFLTPDGTPTGSYNDYRGSNSARTLAGGLRKAYAPLFLSDEKIYSRTGPEILGIVKNTSGAGESVAQKIATTFRSLAERADWTEGGAREEPESSTFPTNNEKNEPDSLDIGKPIAKSAVGGTSLRLHHDIHLHLPPTSDVSVYRAIFQAMKSELM